MIIIEEYETDKRLAEYVRDLTESKAKKPALRNANVPALIRAQVDRAINKMKGSKATGPNAITMEMIKAFKEFGTIA